MSVYIMYAKKKFGWVFCSWDADKDFSLFYANMSKIHSCKLENKYFMIRYSIVMIAVDFVTTTGHLVLWLNFIHHRWKLVIIKIWKALCWLLNKNRSVSNLFFFTVNTPKQLQWPYKKSRSVKFNHIETNTDRFTVKEWLYFNIAK